jgi:hypothetical protein
MKPNKILTEIRQTRDDLARETGYDLKRLFDYVRERERESAARGVKFISPAPLEKQTSSILREEPPQKR